MTEAQLHELRAVVAELNMFLAEHSSGKVDRVMAVPKITSALAKVIGKANDLGVEAVKVEASEMGIIEAK
jgi:hypothetical protein